MFEVSLKDLESEVLKYTDKIEIGRNPRLREIQWREYDENNLMLIRDFRDTQIRVKREGKDIYLYTPDALFVHTFDSDNDSERWLKRSLVLLSS